MAPKPARMVYRELSADGTMNTVDLDEPSPERDRLLAEYPALVRTLAARDPLTEELEESDPRFAGPQIRVDSRTGTVEAW